MFDEQLFAVHVDTAVKCCPSSTVPANSSCSIHFEGTKYLHGDYVVMDCAPSVTVFGQLMLRLLDSSGNEYLLVQIFHGQQNHSLGVYVMQSAVMSILQ